MAQIVPIKIKTGTDMYSQWTRKHKHEGRGIPIVYIVRADGKTLYAKSGKPPTEALSRMLVAALDDAGYIMTQKDVATIEKVTKVFKKHVEAGDIPAALKSLKKAKNYLDSNGNVASYSESATGLQNEISAMMESAATAISEVSVAVGSVDTDDDEKLMQVLEQFEETRQRYSLIKSLKRNLSSIQSKINKDSQMKKVHGAVKLIRSAETATSKSRKEKAFRRLETLISEPPNDAILARAKKTLENSRN